MPTCVVLEVVRDSLTAKKTLHMIKPLVLTALVALGGCATASNTYLNNGQKGLTIDCSGQALSWANCYEKAATSCPSGKYKTVGATGVPASKPEEVAAGAPTAAAPGAVTASAGSTTASPAPTATDVGTFQARTLVISCNQ